MKKGPTEKGRRRRRRRGRGGKKRVEEEERFKGIRNGFTIDFNVCARLQLVLLSFTLYAWLRLIPVFFYNRSGFFSSSSSWSFCSSCSSSSAFFAVFCRGFSRLAGEKMSHRRWAHRTGKINWLPEHGLFEIARRQSPMIDAPRKLKSAWINFDPTAGFFAERRLLDCDLVVDGEKGLFFSCFEWFYIYD